MADRITLPKLFFVSIGGAVALQIGTTAVGLAVAERWATSLLIAGFAVFILVAGFQLVQFRKQNGVWLGGLVSRVVGGTATLASVSYAAALGGAMWSAFEETWWLTVACAVAGGVAYALSGRRWMRAYRSDPGAHGRGESAAWVVVVGTLALTGLVILATFR